MASGGQRGGKVCLARQFFESVFTRRVEGRDVNIEVAIARRREQKFLAVRTELERSLNLYILKQRRGLLAAAGCDRPDVRPGLTWIDVLGHVRQASVVQINREMAAAG